MKLRSYQNMYLGEYFTYDVNNIYEAIVALNLSKKGIEKEINVDKYTAKIQQMKVQESKYGLDKLLKMKKIQLITNKSELKEDYSYIRYENNKYSPIILRKNIIQQKGGEPGLFCKNLNLDKIKSLLEDAEFKEVINYKRCCDKIDDEICQDLDENIKEKLKKATSAVTEVAEQAQVHAQAVITEEKKAAEPTSASLDLNQIIDIMGSQLDNNNFIKKFFENDQNNANNLYKSFLIQINDKPILPYVSLSGYNELCDCILYMDLLNTIEKPPGGGAGASTGSKTKRSPKKKVNLDELIESLTPDEITKLREKLGYNDISSEIDLDDRFKVDTPSTYDTPSSPSITITEVSPEQKKPINKKQKYHLRYILSILFSFFIGILIMWCKESFNNTGYTKVTTTSQLEFKIEKFPLQFQSLSTPITITVDPQNKDTLAGHIYNYIDTAYNPTQPDISSCKINQKTFQSFSPFEKTFIRNTDVFQTYIEYLAFLKDNQIELVKDKPNRGSIVPIHTLIKSGNDVEQQISNQLLNNLYESFRGLFDQTTDGVNSLNFIKDTAMKSCKLKNPLLQKKFLRLHETIVRWKEDIHNEVPVSTHNPCDQGGTSNIPSNAIFIKMHQIGFVQRMVNHYVQETEEKLKEINNFDKFFKELQIVLTNDKDLSALKKTLDTAIEQTDSAEINNLFKPIVEQLDKVSKRENSGGLYSDLEIKTDQEDKKTKIQKMMIETFPSFEQDLHRAIMLAKYKDYTKNALFMAGRYTGTTAYQLAHMTTITAGDTTQNLRKVIQEISFEILESIDKSIVRSYDIDSLNHISIKMFSSLGQKLLNGMIGDTPGREAINTIINAVNSIVNVGAESSIGTVKQILKSAMFRLNAEKEIYSMRMRDPISYIDIIKKFYTLTQATTKTLPKELHGASLEYVDMMIKITKLDIGIGLLKLQYDILNKNQESDSDFNFMFMVGYENFFTNNDITKYNAFFVNKGSNLMALLTYANSFGQKTDGDGQQGVKGGKKLEDKLINAFIENAEANHKPTMNKLTTKKQINDTLKKKLFNSLMKSNPRLFKSIKEYESSVV